MGFGESSGGSVTHGVAPPEGPAPMPCKQSDPQALAPGISLSDWTGSAWSSAHPVHGGPRVLPESPLSYDAAKRALVFVGLDLNPTAGSLPVSTTWVEP